MLDPMIRNRAALAFSGAGLWLLATALPALAQTPPRDPKVVETELRAADERRRALETEAEAIRMDRTRLNAALI